MPLFRIHRRPDLRNAILAGLIGGLAGAWAMSRFSAVWERAAGAGPLRQQTNLMHASPQEWDSTLNAATMLARRVLHHPLRDEQRDLGAVAVHYATGASMGAGYAVLREFLPSAGLGNGAIFGALLWLCAQEIAMPLLHLSGSPRQYSVAAQAQSLGEHLAYGISSELVRRAVQEAL